MCQCPNACKWAFICSRNLTFLFNTVLSFGINSNKFKFSISLTFSYLVKIFVILALFPWNPIEI